MNSNNLKCKLKLLKKKKKKERTTQKVCLMDLSIIHPHKCSWIQRQVIREIYILFNENSK